jgi:hypothetical protein
MSEVMHPYGRQTQHAFAYHNDIRYGMRSSSMYNNTIDDMDKFSDANEDKVYHSPFDHKGDYRRHTVATHTFHGESEFDAQESPDYEDSIDEILDSFNPEVVRNIYEVHTLESFHLCEWDFYQCIMWHGRHLGIILDA